MVRSVTMLIVFNHDQSTMKILIRPCTLLKAILFTVLLALIQAVLYDISGVGDEKRVT